jgi:hypothetical protein
MSHSSFSTGQHRDMSLGKCYGSCTPSVPVKRAMFALLDSYFLSHASPAARLTMPYAAGQHRHRQLSYGRIVQITVTHGWR